MRKCADVALNLVGVSHVEWMQLNAERRRHGLDGAELADASGDSRDREGPPLDSSAAVRSP